MDKNYKAVAAKRAIDKDSHHHLYARYGTSENAKWWFRRPAYSIPGKRVEATDE